MNQKELTETFMMISIKKNLWPPKVSTKKISASILIAPIFFCKIHGDQRVFHFEIIINVLAPTDSFEFLCYGSTATINIFTLTARGATLVVRI